MSNDALIPVIHFEKQVGALCAQHAINALLQNEYYSAVDLASIAQSLDEKEHAALIESGATDQDIAVFTKDGSSNYDDSGFFSSQVIEAALDTWNLGLIPWDSPDASSARENPVDETAFICNLEQHWFTLRRFGIVNPKRWYDLNSMLPQPKLVSDTYLGMVLAQLKQDGYTVYVVRGNFPQCEADLRVSMLPPPSASDYSNAPPPKPSAFYGTGRTLGSGGGSDQSDLAKQAANLLAGITIPGAKTNSSTAGGGAGGGGLRLSESPFSGGAAGGFSQSLQEDEDEMLRAAIEASLKDTAAAGTVTESTAPSAASAIPPKAALAAAAAPVSASPPKVTSKPAPANPRTRIDSVLSANDFAEDFVDDDDDDDELDLEEDEDADYDPEELLEDEVDEVSSSAAVQKAVEQSLVSASGASQESSSGGGNNNSSRPTRGARDEEEEMQRALEASLEEEKRKHGGAVDEAEEMRRKRLARFGGPGGPSV